jgi:putative zinc finger protein
MLTAFPAYRPPEGEIAMNRCQRCQPLILDHLYGLLDGPDAAFVDAHLRECPSCAAARAESARVQGLMAQAARGAFPQVRFEAPATESGTPVAMPSSQRPAVARKSIGVAVWLPWAVAAAVVLAIPGTVIPVLNILNKADAARQEARRSSDRLPSLVDQLDVARSEIDTPRAAARRELAARTQELERVMNKLLAMEKDGVAKVGKVSVDVLKPAALQPGAPNEFHVIVRDGLAAGRSNLKAEIHEVRGDNKRSDAVILTQPLKSHHLEAQAVRLPAEAWSKLTPESELYLVVTAQEDRTGKAEEQDRIRLFGPVYATMLVTDKPTYRPGETLYFRSLTLDRTTFLPPDREQVLEYELFERDGQPKRANGRTVAGTTDLVRVTGGKVEPVLAAGKPIRGVGCGAFDLPADIPEGEYSLVVREQSHRLGYAPTIPTPVVRPIKISSTPPEAFQKLVSFDGAGIYTAGDTVNGCVELRFQGKPVDGAEVRAIASADNHFFYDIQSQAKTGPDGRANFHFTLPKELERGDVRLKATILRKQGERTIEEVVTKVVPVVGRSVVVEFFPEGGDPIAGVPCRVYFRATTPAGQPVDIRGTLTDGRKPIAKVETVTGDVEGSSRGLGSFTYTPQIDTPVWLRLDEAVGMQAPILVLDDRSLPVASATGAVGGLPIATATRTGFVLPAPKHEGVAMTVLDPVTEPGRPIRVHLRSVGTTRKLVVGAYTRGRLSDTKTVTADPKQVEEVALMANADPRGGVVRITVFEAPGDEDNLPKGEAKPDLKPVAERLVFRRPGEALRLSYTVDGTRGRAGAFAPGSTAELHLAATDEKGNPAAAILYAAAVRSNVAPGPRDRLLTTHFLIAGEITTPDAMEYADFLLTDHPKAGEVLDLVLATQGWRRFAEQTRPGFIRRPIVDSEDLKKLIEMNGQYSLWTDPVVVRDQRKWLEQYLVQCKDAVKARDAARAALKTADEDRSAEDRASALAAKLEEANTETRDLDRRANEAAAPVERFQKAGWYGVAGFGLLALLLGVACFARPSGRLPFGIGTAGSIGLVAFLVFALGAAETTQAATKTDVAVATPQAGDVVDSHSDMDALGPVGVTKDAAEPNVAFRTEPKWTAPKSSAGKDIAAIPDAPPKSVGPTVRAKESGPLRTPILPEIARPEPAGPLGRGGMQMGKAPPLPLGGVPAPVPPPGGGGLGAGGTFLRPGTPQITIESTTTDGRSRLATGLMAPAPTPAPADLAFGDRPVELFMDSVRRNADLGAEHAALAKKFAEVHTHELLAEMLESAARKKKVSLDDVKKALTRIEGWNPGVQQGPPVVSRSEALALARFKQVVTNESPLYVREYAAPRPGTIEADSFAHDTILWQPVIVLPADGKTTIPFQLGQADNGYQLVVAGHTLDGRLGAIRGIIPTAPVDPTEPAPTPGKSAPVPPPAP